MKTLIRNYPNTALLTFALIGMYLIMLLAGVHPLKPTAEHLLQWGATCERLTFHGEFYRAFTAMFVHYGIIHLAVNLIFIIPFGITLERAMPSGYYWFVVISSGVVCSVSSAYFNTQMSVGISGVCMALNGYVLMFALRLALKQPQYGIKTIIRNVAATVFNLAPGFFIPGIDNVAHIGGLIYGSILAYVFASIHSNN